MSWEQFWFVLSGCVLAVWPAAIPLVAAVASALVAVKTKSLLWTAVAGVAVYAALAFFAV